MRALALAFAVSATPALAWESTCYTYGDTTLQASDYAAQTGASYCTPAQGPNTARQRWVGGLDEHRLLWEKTRELAGLPAAISTTVKLRVFTSNTGVAVGSQTVLSLLPVSFEQATRAQTRAFSAGELAQLPDFSYALWDWAMGHETCPLDGAGIEADQCHDFATHMGPVNSNHFLPQAAGFYLRYHTLALARARECKAMADALAGTSSRFDAYVKACEIEALAIEAVGHHYLHDAWSMGHAWQRWGSPNLSDFPGTGDDQRDRAVLVALTSGFLHGARGVLQRLPAWTSYDVNDPMCAPNDRVKLLLPNGSLVSALGDDYLDQLLQATYADQFKRMHSCAASAMRQVYEAAGANHGALQPLANGLSTVDPTGAECFAQRATNDAMLAGAGVQFRLAGQQVALEFDSRLVGMLVPHVARSSGEVPVSPALRNRFRLDLQRVVSVARVLAKTKPEGREAADGRLGSFLGARPNSAYTNLATYVDPQLPWPATSDSSPAAKDRANALARLFHQGHAADWCSAVGASHLDALRAHVADVSADAPSKAAACEVCAELAVRHLRVGTSASSYDTTKEPLCRFLVASPAYVYQSGAADPPGLARAWCGCP